MTIKRVFDYPLHFDPHIGIRGGPGGGGLSRRIVFGSGDQHMQTEAAKTESAMIGRLNHVAIAVPDLEAAAAQYRDVLGAEVGAPQPEPDHGVTVVFITLPNTKIELLHPLGEGSDRRISAKEPLGRDPPHLLRSR